MSFPVVAGVAETFRASFWMGSTVGMSVLGATFQAACYVAHGDERGELVAVLPVEHDGSRENAVLVRYFKGDVTGKDIRITIGTPDENRRVLELLNARYA